MTILWSLLCQHKERKDVQRSERQGGLRRDVCLLPFRRCPLTGDIFEPVRIGEAGKRPRIVEQKIRIYDSYKECTKESGSEKNKTCQSQWGESCSATEFIRIRDPFVLIKLANERVVYARDRILKVLVVVRERDALSVMIISASFNGIKGSAQSGTKDVILLITFKCFLAQNTQHS